MATRTMIADDVRKMVEPTTRDYVAVWHGHIVSGYLYHSEKEWQERKRLMAKMGSKYPQGTRLILLKDYEPPSRL